MQRKINILLAVLLLTCFVNARPFEENYKLVYPKVIPFNSQFDVSLVTYNSFSEADELQIFIAPDPRIFISGVLLRTLSEETSFNTVNDYLSNYEGNVYSFSIKLKDSSLSPGNFFQLLFTFKTETSENSLLRFYGIFKKEGKVIGFLNSSHPTDENKERFITAHLKFYKPQKNAGRALLLEKKSHLSFSIDKLPVKRLLSEFWLRIGEPGQEVLTVRNTLTGQKEFVLKVNEFQMLHPKVESASLEFLAPYFIGRKTWSHISILFSTEKNTANFYCDKILFAKIKFTSLLSAGNYEFSFNGNENDKKFSIDLLRFIDLNNTLDVAFLNKNYNDFSADSSSVIVAFKFDEPLQDYVDKNNYSVIFETPQYVKSTAPIFTRAPELNIEFLSNAYELSWTGGDYKQAEKYDLEKSIDNKSFQTIFSVQANNSAGAEYSYIDAIEANAEIVYYRVKQVNYDGANVYSAQLKVGQGESEPLILAQNFPNPFNPKTSIEFELLKDSEVNVTIYNLEGQQVTKLFQGQLSKGVHKFTFDGSGLTSGIYLYKVTTPSFNTTRKMVLTK